MTRFGWWIVTFWPLAAIGQGPAPGSPPAPDTLASIEVEAKSARDSFVEKASKVKSGAEATAADKARHDQILSLMDRALTLARLHPGEPEGVAAAAWAVAELGFERGDDVGERGDAAYRLLSDAPELDDPVVLRAIFAAPSVVPRCLEAERFLRSVISRSQHPGLVTTAQAVLANYLAEMARLHDRLAAPISGPVLMRELTKVCLDRCRAVDGPKLRGEAETLLEQVVREQGDEPKTLGGQAAGELFRIRHLRIGQPAPELVGEDLDGAPIRLSDFRGKVVLLTFWAISSNPRLSLIRQEKDLAAAMKGRPFALVGVNGDAAEDRAKVKETVAKEGITWRSFWAGGPDGAIPREWGVERWPTSYVIDVGGIIRDDQVGGKLTPAAFQPLVQAAEEAAR
ncbi:TlpA family protein disulfide reductase [Paludisphaera mucosa]|uniref:TlpA disulfide reductase family protein n=1 Tax=Paludisphaera mucosa TaxID=3030827 RepID=A0ABT6F425_9BACT|nr:TlpA disulfide reductase family protein [Paludisphaera mucosa]MDG3002188.1 TlpA disulfide reductase family protein [Paludisphaera mucosa]